MSRGRKAGTSVFGLALVSVLVFGAFAASAAQASPKWHRNGKTLQELGLSQMGVNQQGGTLSLEVPGWGLTINCTQNIAWGSAVGESSGSLHLEPDLCSVKYFEKSCKVSPISLDFALGLTEGGGTGVIETFTPDQGEMFDLEMSGQVCPFNGERFTVVYEGSGSLGFEVPAESKHLSLTSIPSYRIDASMGEEEMHISLSGAVEQSEATGARLGAW